MRTWEDTTHILVNQLKDMKRNATHKEKETLEQTINMLLTYKDYYLEKNKWVALKLVA